MILGMSTATYTFLHVRQFSSLLQVQLLPSSPIPEVPATRSTRRVHGCSGDHCRHRECVRLHRRSSSRMKMDRFREGRLGDLRAISSHSKIALCYIRAGDLS